MKKLVAVLPGLIVLVAAGCAARSGVVAQRAALLEADAAWSKASLAKDLERFLSYSIESASLLPPNSPTVAGKEAIRGMWSEFLKNPGFSLSWHASEAEVSRASDMGYTIGTYDLTFDDPAGQATTDRGKYVTIWKRQEDGKWKVAVDIWNSNQPAP